MCIILITVYAAISLGLFFKADMFRESIKNKNKAFEAPLWWATMIILNTLRIMRSKNRSVLLVMLRHPYDSLLICFLALSCEDERENYRQPIRKTKGLFYDTNNLVREKMRFA